MEGLEKFDNIMQLSFHLWDYVWDKKANASPQKMTKTPRIEDWEGEPSWFIFWTWNSDTSKKETMELSTLSHQEKIWKQAKILCRVLKIDIGVHQPYNIHSLPVALKQS